MTPPEVYKIAAAGGATQMLKSFASEMSVMDNREGVLRKTGAFGLSESVILDAEKLEIVPQLRHLAEPPKAKEIIYCRF